MRMKLTVPFVTNPPIPQRGSKVYWDEDPKGFGLTVTSTGFTAFIFNYRHKGVQRRLHFKPGLTLAKARQQARILQGQVATGHDPLMERRKQEHAEANTLRFITDEYFSLEGDELRSAAFRRSMVNKHLIPTLGKRQIDEIRRLEITRLIDRVHRESGPQAANAAMALLRRIMNWHAERSEFKTPIVKAKARGGISRRARVLSDDEISSIWSTATEQETLFGKYLQMLLLTCTRRNEVADMGWSEVDGTRWLIPGSRYKTGLDTLIPLSRATLKVLYSVPKISGSDYIFTVNGRKGIRGFAAWKRDFDKASGVQNWRLHDLRRTGRTLLSRIGVLADIGERCLGHALKGVRAHYDCYEFEREKRDGFERLAGELERITTPPPSNVVQLHG